MNTVVTRKQTSFRIREDLLKRMQEEARRENRSLNTCVESVLMDVMYSKPNKKTLEAMKEAESGVELDTLDMKHFDEYVESL